MNKNKSICFFDSIIASCMRLEERAPLKVIQGFGDTLIFILGG